MCDGHWEAGLPMGLPSGLVDARKAGLSHRQSCAVNSPERELALRALTVTYTPLSARE